jgi:hypothetical protein
MSTSPNSSATQSTNKANSYLLARRRERRNKNRPIDRLIEKRGETTTPPSTEIKVLPKETPSAATTTSTSERRKDQGEKAYNYLSQRRAKRRHRHPIMTQPQKTETASIVEELVEPILSELKPQRLIVLVSIGVSDRTQASNQSRAMTLLQARGTPYVEVDGMDPTQRERCVSFGRITSFDKTIISPSHLQTQ